MMTFENVKKIGSTGILFFILSFLRYKYRLIGWTCAILLCIGLGQVSWGVEINGSREKVTKDLYQALVNYQLEKGRPLKNNQEIEAIQEKIMIDFADEIDWINLYLDGHIYSLTYTPKIASKTEKPSYGILVASDDAIIEKIDVSKGNVLVKRNQHVKKGDVLVSNEIIATNDESKLIEVKGKVYAYLYKTFEASLVADDLAESFVTLHLKILDQVQNEIGEDGHIDQENVLQYERKGGTIILKIQFTLYKNIAKKEILNEQ